MKKRYVLIILASTILGVLVGGMIKDFQAKKSLYIDKDHLAKQEIKLTKKSIKSLKKKKEKIDKEIKESKEKYMDSDEIKEIEELEKLLSYTDISGEGISIKIDALNESVGNIANSIDYNKILINLVNEMKKNGGEFISINNQRINQYTEIILAGSHININSTPIAPPYEVYVIGDESKLSSYLNQDNNYLENISDNYPMKVEYKLENKINMPKMEVPNRLKNSREG